MKRREADNGGHVTELIPGYLLGCLPEEEILEIAKHLSDCSSCLREMEQFARTKEQLLEATPEAEPPAELWDRVRDRIHSVPGEEQPRPLGSSLQPGMDSVGAPDQPNRWFGGRRRGSRRLVTSLAAAIIVALGASTTVLATMVGRFPAAALPTISMASTAGSEWGTEGRAPSGMIVVSKNGEYGTLVVDNLKPVSGREYQLWLIRNETRTSGAVFAVNQEGYASIGVNSPISLTSYSAFGITSEPVGGSASPTGTRVLAGTLSDR